ncbi:CBS domain-containing protein [Thermoanaerobacterium sp. RBIITD]|uniref:magnesium transporter n=1 Tax=Thermoanaerobacterium sp. RBIITD TaxID=1550240 RepID=UPI000BB92B8B|nr:CBS domain-containing protein [Thermoanaerobacterium sp. RBIITD]SNX53749.1 PRC-barrel domain-containing protein [Thermoanaerobacterium sp. RBIITD]
MNVTRFYLSDILGHNLVDIRNRPIGKIVDLVVSLEAGHPKVLAVKIKARKKPIKVDIKNIELKEENERIILQCKRVIETFIEESYLNLDRDIMDKQVVDLNGRKVVRVNDIKLVYIHGDIIVLAVDVGVLGILRRLGVMGIVNSFEKIFKFNIPEYLISWDSIETLYKGIDKLKLSVPYEKLYNLHPADLADIIEDLDGKERAEVFQALDDEVAANALEEIEPDIQVNLLENMMNGRASRILSTMDADEAADILEELEDEFAESILSGMKKDDADAIRKLMKYEDMSVGSIMTSEYVTLNEKMTVIEAKEYLKSNYENEDIPYYLYVVDDNNILKGIISLRKFIFLHDDALLKDVMEDDVISIGDNESIESLIELISKYNLLALPVVDKEYHIIGMALLNDIVDEVFLPRWRKHLRKVS